MSKPPHQIQILRLRRFKPGSVPGIAKPWNRDHGLVRRILPPQRDADSAAAEPAPVAVPKETPHRGQPLHESIVQMYRCDGISTGLIARILGVPQAQVFRVLRGAGCLRHKTQLTRLGGLHDQRRT